jgi:hypothetical protein
MSFTGSDGSVMGFTVGDRVGLDKRTGQIRRNTTISTCRLS